MKVQILSCCYEQPERSAILRESCQKFGLPLKFVEAAQLNGRWTGDFMVSKVLAVLEELQRGVDADLVVWADGFDTFFQKSGDYIHGRWVQAGSPPLLLSAEKNCFPDAYKAPMYDMKLTTDSPFKYICAGAWVGRPWYLLEALPKLIESNRGNADDQRAWTDWYLKDTLGDVQVDVDRYIFQNMWGTTREEVDEGVALIHFNGGSWRNPADLRYVWHWEEVKSRS